MIFFVAFLFGEDLAPVTQQQDNFIHWIRHYATYQINSELNIGQGFPTSPYLALYSQCIFMVPCGNVEISPRIETAMHYLYRTPRPAIHWVNLSGLYMTVSCFFST